MDGYSYAKKKNLKGWKKAGAIVGGAVLGTVNPFKKLKITKVTKKVKQVAKKTKSTKVVAKRVSKAVRKARVVTKKTTRKVNKKATKTYRKVKCKITKKGCFTAGTLISTQDGDVPIEDIEEGDLVWAQDPETGEVALKRVVQTFVKETDTILYIKVAGEVIEATEQHVFYIDNVGWIPASMIEEGDKVVLQSGDKSTVEKIDKVVHNELIIVYNFEVEDFHTYFVSDASVLVHNEGVCVEVKISKSKYPESAKHIEDAIKNGQPEILTIDRDGSQKNRRASLKGIKKVTGADLDEYPPAMFAEGGKGASVRPINPSDNRGSGSTLGHQLRKYQNGTKVKIKVVK